MTDNVSRRAYLAKCGSLSVVMVAGGLSLAGCAKKPVAAGSPACTNTSAISETDRQTRASLSYIDVSTVTDRTCGNCSLFIAPGRPGLCGACQIVKGEIAEGAWCTAWAPKSV